MTSSMSSSADEKRDDLQRIKEGEAEAEAGPGAQFDEDAVTKVDSEKGTQSHNASTQDIADDTPAKPQGGPAGGPPHQKAAADNMSKAKIAIIMSALCVCLPSGV